MPPKGWKKYADGFRPATSAGTPVTTRPVYSLNDLLLPRTVITRLAKQVVSENMALPRDGVTALMRSATVFINYLCAEANRICQQAGHKTITPADVTGALEQLHFGAFVSTVNEDVEAEVARVLALKTRREGYKNADRDEELISEDEASDNDAKRAKVE